MLRPRLLPADTRCICLSLAFSVNCGVFDEISKKDMSDTDRERSGAKRLSLYVVLAVATVWETLTYGAKETPATSALLFSPVALGPFSACWTSA